MSGLTALEQYFSNNRCNHVYKRRPEGIKGTISGWEARFLHAAVLEQKPRICVEIGTGAGVSTAVIANALAVLKGACGGERKLFSFDSTEVCWFDKAKQVGFFLKDFAPELSNYAEIRRNFSLKEFQKTLAPGSVDFAFIDANHKHPWPAIDLLSCLPYLSKDALIVLHDINLAAVMPAFAQSNGAKYLFEGLSLQKSVCTGQKPGELPNMGSLRLGGAEKAEIRKQVLALIERHAWETTVDDSRRALLKP